MTERPLIIANMKYKKPKRTGWGQGAKGLHSTLCYLQYRQDRDTAMPASRRDRWQDKGLGKTHRAIFEACDTHKSKDVLAWTWVISPEPDLMVQVPQHKRRAFIGELSEAIVERYYEERGGFSVPYSYVVHDAATTDGRPHTHAHVILPGMAEHPLSGWEPFVNFQSRGHLTLLDEIANDELIHALDKEIGPKWRVDFGLEMPAPDDPNDLDAWFPRL